MNFCLIDSKGLSVNTHCSLRFEHIWKVQDAHVGQLFGGSSGSFLRRSESFQGRDRVEEHRPGWRRDAVHHCSLSACFGQLSFAVTKSLRKTAWSRDWLPWLVAPVSGWLTSLLWVCGGSECHVRESVEEPQGSRDKLSSSRARLWTSTCVSFYHFLIVNSTMFLCFSCSGGSPESLMLTTQALCYWAASPSTVHCEPILKWSDPSWASHFLKALPLNIDRLWTKLFMKCFIPNSGGMWDGWF